MTLLSELGDLGKDAKTKFVRSWGKSDCIGQGDIQPAGAVQGDSSCQTGVAFLAASGGRGPLRGSRVSSSPNSKCGLLTFLFVSKKLCLPNAAFQNSIELLKTNEIWKCGIDQGCFLPVTTGLWSDSEGTQCRHE